MGTNLTSTWIYFLQHLVMLLTLDDRVYGHLKRCRYRYGEIGEKSIEGGVDEGFEAEPAIRVGGEEHRFFVSSPHFAIRHSERGHGTEPGKVRIRCRSRTSSRCKTSE